MALVAAKCQVERPDIGNGGDGGIWKSIGRIGRQLNVRSKDPTSGTEEMVGSGKVVDASGGS